MRAEELLGIEFLRTHPEDAARVLERFAPAESAGLLSGTPSLVAAAIVEHMVLTGAASCLAAMPVESAATILAEHDRNAI